MINVDLIKIDPSIKKDQLFLYEILKFRWKNYKKINIKYKCSEKFPTFDEHCSHITSGKYKVFYKILLGDFEIGTIYIDKNDVNGTFILPNLLKKALVKYKTQKLNIGDKPLSAHIHIKLFELHPEIKTHYASVNPENKASLNSLIDNGYEFIECILAIKTENGKVLSGKWSENYESL
jgi:hypothetical protein